MWDETLIESGGGRKKGGGWSTVAFSAGVHTVLVLFIIGATYWYLEAVEPLPNSKRVVFGVAEALPSDTIPVAFKKGTSKGNDIPAKPADSKPLLQAAELTQEAIRPASGNEPADTPVDSTWLDQAGSQEIGTGPLGSPDGTAEDGPVAGAGDPDQPIVIQTGVESPVLISKVQPAYPDIMRRAGIQGVIILRAVISKAGDVEVREVLKSLHPMLDREAIKAVNQWKYRPATIGNRPVSVWFTVTVSYKLK